MSAISNSDSHTTVSIGEKSETEKLELKGKRLHYATRISSIVTGIGILGVIANSAVFIAGTIKDSSDLTVDGYIGSGACIGLFCVGMAIKFGVNRVIKKVYPEYRGNNPNDLLEMQFRESIAQKAEEKVMRNEEISEKSDRSYSASYRSDRVLIIKE